MFSSSLEEAVTLFAVDQHKLQHDRNIVKQSFLDGALDKYLQLNYDYTREYAMRDVEVLKNVTEQIVYTYENSGINYNTIYTHSMASVQTWKNMMDAETNI